MFVYCWKRRQKEKRINPPAMGTASNPSSPSTSPQPPFVTSPGRIFGSSNPGGPLSPSASLTPFSGSPGKIWLWMKNTGITNETINLIGIVYFSK